jgi:hypothetical protein
MIQKYEIIFFSIVVVIENSIQKLCKNSAKTFQKLFKNFSKTFQKLFKNFSKTFQKLFKNFLFNILCKTLIGFGVDY